MLSNRGRKPGRGAPLDLFIDAQVIAFPRISGIGHTLHGMVRALARSPAARERYRITLLVPWDGFDRVRSMAIENTRLLRMPLPIRGWDRWPSLPLLPPLDVFVGRGHFIFPHYVNWPMWHSGSVTFVHDIAFLRHPETVGGNLRMLSRNVSRWIARTSLVATVSQFSRGEISQYLGVHPSRIVVIPWGVDTTHFRPAADSAVQRVRQRHALPERYVLFLGNVQPRKNLARLVRAYRRLPDALRAEHALILAGGARWNETEVMREIEAARRAGDKVRLLDEYVDDAELPALISGSSLLAQPSVYEGFGIAPLQAMACDVPVIVGRNSAQPEVVGDAGVYVDAGDEADIARGLEQALTDTVLRGRLVAAGRERVARFTWERTADSMLQALDGLRR